jgi:hypothetical protein
VLTRGPELRITEEQVDESVGRTPTAVRPEALIEEARQRARRRRWWTAAAVLLSVTGIVVGVAMSGGSGSSTSSHRSGTRGGGHTPLGTSAKNGTVDLAATPKGWVPFAYLDAQVSVPASWIVQLSDCGDPNPSQPVIYLSGCFDSGNPCIPSQCRPSPHDWLMLEPLDAAQASSDSSAPVLVNGYRVYKVRGTPQSLHPYDAYDIPSLGVEINGFGPMIPKIISTLSASPRAAVLASGGVSAIPGSWRRVSFGGISLAVPKMWPIARMSAYNGCWLFRDLPMRPTVDLNSGTAGLDEFSNECPPLRYQIPVSNPPDGVVADPGGYRREGTSSC